MEKDDQDGINEIPDQAINVCECEDGVLDSVIEKTAFQMEWLTNCGSGGAVTESNTDGDIRDRNEDGGKGEFGNIFPEFDLESASGSDGLNGSDRFDGLDEYISQTPLERNYKVLLYMVVTNYAYADHKNPAFAAAQRIVEEAVRDIHENQIESIGKQFDEIVISKRNQYANDRMGYWLDLYKENKFMVHQYCMNLDVFTSCRSPWPDSCDILIKKIEQGIQDLVGDYLNGEKVKPAAEVLEENILIYETQFLQRYIELVISKKLLELPYQDPDVKAVVDTYPSIYMLIALNYAIVMEMFDWTDFFIDGPVLKA